ncbi:MAG TPA: hypothetical protein O0X39_03510 [Methanocorpusculum sp.]|nr:hypothetical protein [Methanocorpusculum sp.]
MNVNYNPASDCRKPVKNTLMSAKRLSLILTAAVLLLCVCACPAGAADMTGSNWMSFLPDCASIGQINMPGTHDSGAFNINFLDGLAEAWGACQDKNVIEQFNAGCRWFDFRYVLTSDYGSRKVLGYTLSHDYLLCHGPCACHDSDDSNFLFFTDGVADLRSRLNSNPDEFVVITYQFESGYKEYNDNWAVKLIGGDDVKDESTSRTALEADIDLFCSSDPAHYVHLKTGDTLPNVGDAAGKIFFIRSGQYSKTEDHYEDVSTSEKKNYLKTLWDKSKAQDYEKTCKLSSSLDPDSASPIVAFTSFTNEGTLTQNSDCTSWIANGGYSFTQGNYYGVVLFNDVTADACKKIYQSNMFTIPVDIPVAETSLVYNGAVQTGVKTNAKYTLTGNTATNAGTYTAVATLKSTDYSWSDGTTSAKSISWTIARKPLSIPAAVKNLVYTGTAQTGVPSGTGYTITGNTATDAATYTASAVPDANYKWSDGTTSAKSISWEIARKPVNVPSAVENLIYTGTAQTGVPSGTGYTITGNTATDAATYTASAVPGTNYKWSDGTTSAKSISWSIAKTPVNIPSAVKNLVYTGETQTGVPSGTGYTITGNTAKNAGTYTASAVPGANYKWSDGTSSAKSISWEIAKAPVDIPAPVPDLVYTGNTQTGVKRGTGYSIAGNTAVYAGTYTAAASLSSNYKWSDGTTESKTIPWEIARKPVNTPTPVPDLVYTGETQTGVMFGTGYTITGNTGKESGTYTASASLLNTNYAWSDGTTEPKTIPWEIARKPVNIPAAVTGLVYNEETQTGVPSGTGYTITGNTAVDAGTYTAVASPDANYKWSDGTTESKSIPWEIAKKSVTIPEAVPRLVNNGETQTGVRPAAGCAVTGNTALLPGAYTAVAALQNNNYIWSDGTTEPKTISWSIDRRTVLNITVTPGEMTKEHGTYTAVVTYVPGEDQTLSAFAFGLESDTPEITVTPKTFGGTDFIDTEWNLQTVNNYYSGTNPAGKALTASQKYYLGTYTIDTSGASALTGDVTISFGPKTSFLDSTAAEVEPAKDTVVLSRDNPHSLLLNPSFAAAGGESYTSGKITGLKTEKKTELTAVAEDNTNQFIVLNELGQKMTDSSKFRLTYTSNDAVRLAVVHDSDGTAQVPYYIGLVGNTSQAPAVLTAVLSGTDDTELDTLDVEFSFAKAAVGTDIDGGNVFSLAETDFEYTGKSLYDTVYSKLTVLNHNDANKAGIKRDEEEFADGFARAITQADCQLIIYKDGTEVTDPQNNLTEDGNYTFEVSLTGNEHYDSNPAITSGIAENPFSFSITAATVAATAEQDACFNAENKATIYITYTTHSDPSDVTLTSFSPIPAFTHYQQSLQLPDFNINRSENLPDSSRYEVTRAAITIAEETSPAAQTTRFCIEGGLLGDVNGDGEINLKDTALIAIKLAGNSFTDEEKFYGNIFGNSGNPGIVDAKLITLRYLGCLDADYRNPA